MSPPTPGAGEPALAVPSAPPSSSWHSTPAARVVEVLESDPQRGLSQEEAEGRLEQYGPNQLLRADTPGWAAILARQFTSVLTVLLLVAALTSGVVLGEWVDAAAIGAIVMLNTVIGFVQESRAAAALAALQSLAVPRAHVIRGGTELEIDSVGLVPGDLLVLEAGDRVAADARVLSTVDFEVDESTLTGESLPVEKSDEAVGADVALGDRTNIVHAGTTIARGRARAMVVATGATTEVGKLAGLTTEKEPPTPLQRELDVIGKRLAIVAGVAAALIVALGIARGVRVETIVLTGVALAVAVIPEGLPTVVAVTLARGMERMARWNALVRRLAAVEALGAAGVICSDKTGTLTENRMAVRQVALFDRVLEAEQARSLEGHELVSRVLDVMVGCNDAYRSDDGLKGDAIDVALLQFGLDAGIDIDRWHGTYPRLDEVPFESGRKRMDVTVDTPGGPVTLVKGAPETIIDGGVAVDTPAGVLPLDHDRRTTLHGRAEAMARSGLRTLGLARDAGEGLTVVGLVGLADPARAGVAQSVAEAHRAGIDVVMITGDHAVTARAIAEQVGILEGSAEVMDGNRLRAINQQELDREIDRYRAFARVDPVDKVKIVAAWQHHGRVVAMTGDGVNDGPALRAADIGVAMGSGTDVAKDAAGVVLEDDDFSTIVNAVREGRKIFGNLRNVVHYLLSANISEIVTMVVGFTFFGSLGEPLRAAQLLWINLVSDGLPALALGLDDPEHDVMAQRPGAGRDVLSARNLLLLGVQGLLMGLAAIAMIGVGHHWLGREWVVVQTMIFTTLVVTQLLHVFNAQGRTRLAGRVGLAVLGSMTAHVLVLWLPFTRTAFDIVSLGAIEWVAAVIAAVAGFLLARAAGAWFRSTEHAARPAEVRSDPGPTRG